MKLEKEIMFQLSYIIIGGTVLQFKNDFTKEEREILEKIRHKKVKLTLEVKEPILDDEERKYLSGVIKPFRDRVTSIVIEDMEFENLLQVIIYYDNDKAYFTLPPFEIGTMYKGMELNKEYTLEDLQL